MYGDERWRCVLFGSSGSRIWAYDPPQLGIGGEVDVYVKHLTVDELRREFGRESEDMQRKSKWVVLEEIDEDLGHYGVDDASPSEVDIGNNGANVRGNEVESGRLNEAEGEYVVAHGISQCEEKKETGSDEMISKINLEAFDKFTMAAKNFDDFFNSRMEENFHAQTVAEDQVNDDVITEDGREEQLDPIWSLNGIIAKIKVDFSFTIDPVKAWEVREFALRTINGDEVEQYRTVGWDPFGSFGFKVNCLLLDDASNAKWDEAYFVSTQKHYINSQSITYN
ncbi:hypothetical protein GH714_017214 [Hevea brasiliensis]|uniref:Uncharacterized protein n=1 Tax=Hevea brasiliensis TaxID=3981 RepID=A0A6A6LBV6_HEVBR|nr:hypothetical protein GH714_017214 [Hevea brasiliensis]